MASQLLALMSEEDFADVVDTNLTGAYRVSQARRARRDPAAPRPDRSGLLSREDARFGRAG
jgi:3-oxoacyl-[acyl-carrier protein] reductase